jgi:energy-coupling factor transporter transmembrane protein EcfT
LDDATISVIRISRGAMMAIHYLMDFSPRICPRCVHIYYSNLSAILFAIVGIFWLIITVVFVVAKAPGMWIVAIIPAVLSFFASIYHVVIGDKLKELLRNNQRHFIEYCHKRKIAFHMCHGFPNSFFVRRRLLKTLCGSSVSEEVRAAYAAREVKLIRPEEWSSLYSDTHVRDLRLELLDSIHSTTTKPHEKIWIKIQQVMEREYGVPVQPEMSLLTIGNKVELLNFVTALEIELGVELDFENILQMKTFSNLLTYIVHLTSTKK